VLKEMSLQLIVKGDVDPTAVGRALQLSEERLCPIWNMLKTSTAIKADYQVEQPTAEAPVT
jgi:uncharacterized OsmC-like protein